MAIIPMHILRSCILTRLPAKSLLRFKCVSKSWLKLISSADFIHLHHRHSPSSDENRNLIFTGNSHTLHLQNLDSPLAPPSLRTFSCHQPPFYNELCMIEIVASCEFFLLIRCRCLLFNYVRSKLILLNPTTGSYYKLPYHKQYNSQYDNDFPSIGPGVTQYGLFYDEANDDYKVVQIIEYKHYLQNKTKRQIRVYSFIKKRWRVIEQTMDTFCFMSGNISVINHLLHTIFCSLSDPENGNVRIGCFDILAEQWTDDVPLPHISNLNGFEICVLEGLLCLLGKDREEVPGTYCVWVMKEYGVKDSWMKLMSIVSNSICRPIAYRKGSRDELLCICAEKLYWHNLRDKKVTRVMFNGVPGDGGRTSGHICKGSLVCFPGGQLRWPKRMSYKCRRGDRFRKKYKRQDRLPKRDVIARRTSGR